MIVTVTMNPAIDKTVEIEKLTRGGLNRIKAVEADAGGKGINVSKTLKALGQDSVAVGFLGGNAGRTMEHALDELGILHDFVWVEGETRTNTKVYESDGTLTELNEAGPVISEEQVQELFTKLEACARPGTLFVLAGSVPKGVKKDCYRKIIEMAHAQGANVLLDADGELFAEGMKAIPELMKPNGMELSGYAGCEAELSEERLLRFAEGFLKKGVKRMMVSMGDKGALFLENGYQAKCPALPVQIHSTVGAGDAMAAALALSWERHLGREETIKTCMAASAGAVMTVGTKPPTTKQVDFLKTQVVIEEIRNSSLKERLSEFEAVLFDMDGTLVDSMWMWETIDREYLGKYGFEVPEDLKEAIGGMSFTETAIYIKERFGIKEEIEEMKDTWNKMAWEKYRHEVPYKNGAREFLEQCKKMGIKMGVATSNSRDLVNAVGESLGFETYISCIVTSCEVKKGKPAPDVYLAAAEKLGVLPGKCLVFEDIVQGIRAGKNAGMCVCAVEDRYSAKSADEKRMLADYYIEDYRELL